MADPQKVEILDSIDVTQVILYRTGITASGVALFFPVIQLIGIELGIWFHTVLIISCSLIAASLHIYNKGIRLIISSATWIALVLIIMNQLWNLGVSDSFIHGVLFITLSGVGFKESFCFKVPGLTFLPLILCISAFSELFGFLTVSLFFTTLSAILVCTLSIAKWRMPLHFDIGDKRNYQN